ncbi:MAG: penicillin acylase family protein [Candidatus Obscuribacterales bacterium]|nr:penicillin acylase family protein [Candidatus Obscuribacterales bacterium]
MIKTILLAVLFVAALSPLAGWWFVQRPLPGLDGFGDVGELQKPVLVRFDARAVPYVEAESDEDMYAAQGYLLARDRMFQMDLLRRGAEGKYAEIFGIGYLPGDKLMRTIGFERLAQEEFSALSVEAKNALEAYAHGVNAYLEEFSDRLPVEFIMLGYKPQPWRGVDSLAILKYYNYELDESWKLDEFRSRVTNKVGDAVAAELFRDDWSYSSNAVSEPAKISIHTADSLRQLASLPGALRKPAPTWGSTAWALPSISSQSGGALLAADKHGGFSSPADWYLCSLSSAQCHVAGACLPGVPGVLFGRNDNIAWSSAALKADVQDLFVEHFDSEFGNKYQTDSGEKSALVTNESVPVRFGKDVQVKITATKHGPVLLRDKESAVALSWTGFDCTKPMLNSVIALAHAANRSDFEKILQGYAGAPQLFVYADKQGNIGCQAAGLIPVRSGSATGTTMSEGWMKKGTWLGLVPFSELPRTFLSGNSSELCIAAGQKLTTNIKPLLGHQWSPPYRANRLSLSLPQTKNGQKLNLSDCNAFQGDDLNMLSHLVVDNLKQALAKTKSIDASQVQALSLMRNWDGRMKVDSAAATIYESFIAAFARRLVEPKLGRALTSEYFERWPLWITFVEHNLRQKPKEFLPSEERTYDTFLVTTFAQANTRLKLFFNNENVPSWLWGKVHLAQFKHMFSLAVPAVSRLFDSQTVAVGGNSDCLNACDVQHSIASGPFHSQNGPTVRLLVDMSDNDKLYGDIVLGQSGQLLSPFRQDQLQSWLRVDPLPIAFSAGQLDRQTRHRLYLSGNRSR